MKRTLRYNGRASFRKKSKGKVIKLGVKNAIVERYSVIYRKPLYIQVVKNSRGEWVQTGSYFHLPHAIRYFELRESK